MVRNNSNQIILNEKSDFDVLEEMASSNYGEHNILIYPDKAALRDVYSCYCKLLFEYNNTNNSSNGYDEMVLLIPFYETVQGVKHTLRKRAGIDIEKYEKDGSLAIIDSFEAYSRQSLTIAHFDQYLSIYLFIYLSMRLSAIVLSNKQ
jgi:hypothetical protein